MRQELRYHEGDGDDADGADADDDGDAADFDGMNDPIGEWQSIVINRGGNQSEDTPANGLASGNRTTLPARRLQGNGCRVGL